MTKYIIIETTQTDAPEDATQQASIFFDTFEEAQLEIQSRYAAAKAQGKAFNQSISTREV